MPVIVLQVCSMKVPYLQRVSACETLAHTAVHSRSRAVHICGYHAVDAVTLLRVCTASSSAVNSCMQNTLVV
jgi:hypothetical protein